MVPFYDSDTPPPSHRLTSQTNFLFYLRNRKRFTTTPPKSTHLKNIHRPPSPDSDSDQSSVPNLERHDSELSLLSEATTTPETLIPQPRGAVGRPNSGGFNIVEALGWTEESFTKLQVS
jgi:hypothetical protein